MRPKNVKENASLCPSHDNLVFPLVLLLFAMPRSMALSPALMARGRLERRVAKRIWLQIYGQKRDFYVLFRDFRPKRPRSCKLTLDKRPFFVV